MKRAALAFGKGVEGASLSEDMFGVEEGPVRVERGRRKGKGGGEGRGGGASQLSILLLAIVSARLHRRHDRSTPTDAANETHHALTTGLRSSTRLMRDWQLRLEGTKVSEEGTGRSRTSTHYCSTEILLLRMSARASLAVRR
jgi:hypothetical protein